jgi:mRNA interferase HigB
VADNRIIFDVGGNKFRIVVRVSYRYKNMMIRFVADRQYDRIDVETV